jgi:hypothetical protein
VQQAFQCLVDGASQPEEPVKVDEGLGQDAINRFMKDTEEFDDVPEQQIDADTKRARYLTSYYRLRLTSGSLTH